MPGGEEPIRARGRRVLAKTLLEKKCISGGLPRRIKIGWRLCLEEPRQKGLVRLGTEWAGSNGGRAPSRARLHMPEQLKGKTATARSCPHTHHPSPGYAATGYSEEKREPEGIWGVN